MLRIDVVILDSLHAHRLERAKPHVQRDRRALDAARLELVEQPRGEMQAGRGRRHRSGLVCIHRLVPFAIGQVVVSLDVRRKRHVTDALDRVGHGFTAGCGESNRSTAEKVAMEHLALESQTITLEHHLRTGLELLTRMHEGFPLLGIPDARWPDSQAPDQQTLDGAAAWHPVSEQPRGEDTRVVQHQEVAPAKMRRKPIEGRMLPCPCRTIDDDEARRAALGGRVLSDQLLGEIEIEVADVHDPKKRPRSVRPRLSSSGFHRSPTLAMRWRTLSSLKSSILAPFSTSFQVSGVDTVARGFGRTE